jgi:hypothetical protein
MTCGLRATLTLVLLLGACSSADETAGGDPYDSANNGVTTASGEHGDGDGDTEGGTDTDQADDETGMTAADLPADPLASCDPWAQDCPPDEKCSWEHIEGVPHTRCVPVEPDAKLPGESCTVFGDPDSGYDDCVLGALCQHLDAQNQGICVELCGGSLLEPICEQDGATCHVCPDCPSLCMPLCDPLAQDCGEGFACIPDSGSFACHPSTDVGRGAFGDACEYTFQCQAGFACIDALEVPDCEGLACCSPFCSTSEPTCPEGTSCVPWFEIEEALLPNLGICKA